MTTTPEGLQLFAEVLDAAVPDPAPRSGKGGQEGEGMDAIIKKANVAATAWDVTQAIYEAFYNGGQWWADTVDAAWNEADNTILLAYGNGQQFTITVAELAPPPEQP